MSVDKAEFANAPVVCSRAPGSNLSINRKYFLVVFVLDLNLNMLAINF
jgi:hypothetical protein